MVVLLQFDSADVHFPLVTKVHFVMLLLLLGLSKIIWSWSQFLFVLQQQKRIERVCHILYDWQVLFSFLVIAVLLFQFLVFFQMCFPVICLSKPQCSCLNHYQVDFVFSYSSYLLLNTGEEKPGSFLNPIQQQLPFSKGSPMYRSVLLWCYMYIRTKRINSFLLELFSGSCLFCLAHVIRHNLGFHGYFL